MYCQKLQGADARSNLVLGVLLQQGLGVLLTQLRRHLHHALQEVDASGRHPGRALEGGLQDARVHGLHPLCC